MISPKHIEQVSYEESKVYVNVTKEAILKAPEYHMPDWAFQDFESGELVVTNQQQHEQTEGHYAQNNR